jgi:DNA topoisomerase I
MGKKTKAEDMPRRAAIPKGKRPDEVSLEDALRYLTLPRDLGTHPETHEPIIANVGRFGPYIVHAGDFRSLKGGDDPYTITYERALEILKEPKKTRAGEKVVKEVGLNPKTKSMIRVFESKSGKYLKRGFKRISLPDDIDLDSLTVDDAIALLKVK